MKINDRDKTLLTVLAIVVMLVFLFMFLLPPLVDELKTLKEKQSFYAEEIAAMQENIQYGQAIRSEYKDLNVKALAFSSQFYTELRQEELIMDLNKLFNNSGLIGHNISFTELAKKNAQSAGEGFSTAKSMEELMSMDVTINYNGSFNQFLSFLNKVGEFDKKILIDSVTIINASQKNGENLLAGNLALEFFAVPSFLKDATDFLSEQFTGIGGVNEPFSGVSLMNAEVVDLLTGRTRTVACDFVLTAKPITADLPTVILGLDNDISAESFVSADSPEVEKAEVHLFMSDGKYLCKYSAGQETYPQDEAGVEIPFASTDKNVVLNIFSNPRVSETDFSGVNLSLFNETDMSLIVNVINEDPDIPRVNIVSQEGKIEIQ